MDNDLKVTISKPEVELFLNQNLFPKNEGSGATYNLEEEYAKTKNNRSFKVWAILGATVLATLLGVLSTHFFVKAQNNKIAVSVEEFEELNLKALLDSVARVENELNLALAQKKKLDVNYAEDIHNAEQQRDNDLYTLQSLNLTRAEYAKQSNAVTDQCKRSIALIEANYKKATAEIDARIEELTGQLAAMDSANIEQAQKFQSEFDSQKQLYELEKEALVKSYELQLADMQKQIAAREELAIKERKRAIDTVANRYKAEINRLNRRIAELDPVWVDEYADAIIYESSILDNLDQKSLISQLDKKALSESDLYLVKSIDHKNENLAYLNSRIFSLPMENSITRYLEAQKNLSISMQNDTADLLDSMISVRSGAEKTTVSLQQLLSSFRYYLDMQLKESGDAGCVLDSRDKNRLVIYISPLYSDAIDGRRAYIFREAENFLCEVTLKQDGEQIFATCEEPYNFNNVVPGDRVLIDFNW
mgnify:CR=1 FL=1